MIRALAVVIAIAAFPLIASPYMLTLANYAGMAAIVAIGLVLLTGVGGLTSFGQAAFVGLGAYVSGWLTTSQGVSPWLGLLAAIALTSAVAALLGAATLRLSGHLLPLSTIAWGLALFFLFGNLDALGRHSGLSDIPPAGAALRSGLAGYAMIWGAVALCLLFCANVLDSRTGRAIRALRGGSAMTESLGINTFATRLAIFTIAGAFAGVSGWLLAHVQRFLSPTAFDVGPGMEYLFMAILGGAGHLAGAVLGAVIVTVARDRLQDVLAPFGPYGAQLEVVVFGVLFILILQRARGGIIPAILRRLPRSPRPNPPDAPPLPRRTLPPPGTMLLEVDRITRRFGGLVAVNEVSFTLASGEILGLIGPNGAGKSTLFNLITGLLRPNAGRIRLLGRDITGAPIRRIAGLGLARTFQHVKLRPGMSALENTMLGAHKRGRASMLAAFLRLDRTEEARLRAEAMRQLRRVGLGEAPHAQAGSLALGQQRILEVARALAADPLLVILDEPAAGLRRPEKQALADLLRQLRAEGVTILLVEHDMDFVMSLVDRIVVMDFGTRLAEGLPADIRANPAVQEAYLGGVA